MAHAHRTALPLAVLLAACQDQAFSRLQGDDTFEQAPSNAVDILWVVDNSVSMQNEQENVARGFADFVAQLDTGAMDVHLGVVSTDMDAANPQAGVLLGTPAVLTPEVPGFEEAFRSRVRMGVRGSDKEKGLEAALTALSSPLADTRNAGFLRDDAMLNVVVLSDENDCSDSGALGPGATGEMCYTDYERLTPVAEIVRSMKMLKPPGRVVVSGIVGPEIVENCEDTVPGRRYFTAIDMLGGVRADICQTDYSAIMSALGQVASGILTTFQLSRNAVEETIVVTVTPSGGEPAEIARDEANGWTYVSAYAQIVFHGSAVPPRGATIDVTYEVAPGRVAEAPGDTAAP
jgi:hypothetical protein